MIKIPDNVKHFLDKQHFVIISTLDKRGTIHTSAKGVVEVDPRGKIFIMDLYKARTYRNIKHSPHATLTIIDERKFKGYSIRGKARILKEGSLPKNTLKIWHDKLATRIARRIIRHVKEETPSHEVIPEARFPFPKYLIEVDVDGIVDLAPHKLKEGKWT